MANHRNQPRTKVAFGVEPSTAPYRLRLSRYEALAQTLAEHVRAASADRTFKLLDIGVGRGRTLRYLEPLGVADRIDFHGIDLSPERLAGVYSAEKWKLVHGDATQGLPYPDGQFDFVICEQVLEHLEAPEGVLKEIGRVMAPGGLFIAGVPTFPPGVVHARRHLVPLVDKVIGKDRGHVQAYSKSRFVQQIRWAGCFEVVAVRGFRVVSDGIFLPLEDYRWWWRFNRVVGRVLPSLCVEIQVLARRKADNSSSGQAATT